MAHYDPFHPNPERPLALVGGGATCVRGRHTLSWTVGAGQTYVGVFNARGGAYCLSFFQYLATPSTLNDYNLLSQMYTPAPDTALITKGGIQIVDVTKALDRGGVLKVLRTPQSLLIDPGATISVAQQDAIVNFVRGSPHTKVHGTDMVEGKTFLQHIVDGVKYQQFEAFRATTTDMRDHLDDPALSNIILLAEAYSGASRTFEVTIGATAYVRYPAIGVLQSMQKAIPRASQETIMAHNSIMDAVGSAASYVGDAALTGLSDAVRQVSYYGTGRALAGAMRRLPAIAG